MTQQPPGWYDDPSDPTMLRYWDGVTWTSHTTPRKSPTASQSTIGHADQAPTTPLPQGGWRAQSPQPGGPPPQYPGDYPGAGQQNPSGGQNPYGGQYPVAPQSQAWMRGPVTADGVPLASWGKRFGAWLIDGLILAALSYFALQLFAPGYFDTVQQFVDLASTGDQAALEGQIGTLTEESLKASIVTWLTITAYCVAFWTTTSQTPGKMVLRISVRRADRPGALDLATALRRRLLSLIQLIPFISGIYAVIWLLDGLWPLWDNQRQALHDKVGATQVVEGRQPRRSS